MAHEADVDFYAGEFARTGFRGGLNWYRNLDRTWELMAPWRGARITVPRSSSPATGTPSSRSRAAVDGLEEAVPGLRERVLLPGAGHWTQQERPREVNDALITFLAGLPDEPLSPALAPAPRDFAARVPGDTIQLWARSPAVRAADRPAPSSLLSRRGRKRQDDRTMRPRARPASAATPTPPLPGAVHERRRSPRNLRRALPAN